MTSSDSTEPAPVRRSRRAVRHAGTVGGDDANLVSTHPALQTDTSQPDAGAPDTRRTDAPHLDAGAPDTRQDPGTGPPHPDAGPDDTRPDVGKGHARDGTGRAGDGRATTAQPVHDPVVATRSADDSDVGWGDRETGSNDDRLHQDKPPHW